MPTTLVEDERRLLAKQIDTTRREKRLKISALAHQAGCTERTLGNLLAGRSVRLETFQAVCHVLGLDSTAQNIRSLTRADEEHGSYHRDDFENYLGQYLVYRWSYQDPLWINRSGVRLTWSEIRNCVIFEEYQKYTDSYGMEIDFSQSGEIYRQKDDIGLLQMLTVYEGSLRLITLTKMQWPSKTMKGCVLTQARSGVYKPAVSPILFKKVGEENDDFKLANSAREFELDLNHDEYKLIAKELRRIEREVVRSTFMKD